MGGRGSKSGITDSDIGGFSFRMADGKTVEYNKNSMGVVFKNGVYNSDLTKNKQAYSKLKEFAKKSTTYVELDNKYFENKAKQRAEENRNKEDYELNPVLSGIGKKQRGKTIKRISRRTS